MARQPRKQQKNPGQKVYKLQKHQKNMKKLVLFLLAFCILAGAAFAQNDTNSLNQLSAKQEWLLQTKTATHKIMLIDVTEKGDACGFNVDGYSTWINVGKDATINGVYIKVFEAYPVHSQLQDTDVCKVFIGGGALVREVAAENITANASSNVTANVSQNITINATAQNKTGNISSNLPAKQPENPTIWQIIIRFLAGLFGRKV